MKYRFIERYKQEFAIAVMCDVLGVSESGFYAWRKRPVSSHHREDAHLIHKLRQAFDKHKGRYGSPRLHKELQEEGISCSRKRVARLMREGDLAARRRR